MGRVLRPSKTAQVSRNSPHRDVTQILIRRDCAERSKSLTPLDREPKLYPVIRCVHQILLRAQIPLGRLDRSVAQQQLDLLKFPARRATQFRAGPATVVRGDSGYSGCQRVRLEQL